jgi:DNA-binding NtrC family response regulator
MPPARGVNSLVAADAASALDIIERRSIHTAIVDMDSAPANGLSIIRVIRNYHPMLPCILVSCSGEQNLLSSALALDVFSVIAKPVDMRILQDQLNRLFIKKYNSMIFNG